MWTQIITGIVGVYAAAATFFFFINMKIGPVTPGLALLRGALWPLWLAGGLQGRPEPMD